MKKNWPQNKYLRFPLHKIQPTEKKQPKNKIFSKNKDLRFPLALLKKVFHPKFAPEIELKIFHTLLQGSFYG